MTLKIKYLPLLAALTMAMPLFGCGSDDTDTEADDISTSDSSADTEDSSDADSETEDATVQENIPLEYDGTEVDDSCAETIGKYFTAIINQKYDDYKDTLDPYYYQVYNSWLDGTYGYGMETSFETMHETLMDAAVSANDGEDVDEIYITKLTLYKTEPAEDEDESDLVDDYLAEYDNIIGDGFTEELKKQCDDVVNVTFTMTASCDGTELDIFQDMELLMTLHDGEYKILG